MIDVKSIVLLGFLVVACGGQPFEPELFGAGGAAAGAGGAGTGGSAGAAGAGGVAGAEDSGVDAVVVGDADVAEAMTVCNATVCDEQTGCAATCTVGDTTKWCRKFNGVYQWIVQAFCGAAEFPFGSTLLECDDAGLRVCCAKTGNWETSC